MYAVTIFFHQHSALFWENSHERTVWLIGQSIQCETYPTYESVFHGGDCDQNKSKQSPNRHRRLIHINQSLRSSCQQLNTFVFVCAVYASHRPSVHFVSAPFCRVRFLFCIFLNYYLFVVLLKLFQSRFDSSSETSEQFCRCVRKDEEEWRKKQIGSQSIGYA